MTQKSLNLEATQAQLKQNWLLAYMLSFSFLFFPITWGYLFKTGGFLVRPSDILITLMSVIIFARGKVYAPQHFRLFFVLLIGFIVSLMLSSILNGIPSASLFKIVFLAQIPLVIHQVIYETNYQSPTKVFILPLVIFVFLIPELILHIYTTISTNSGNLTRMMFLLWNGAFSINPFGPDDLQIRGVSFRNSFAMGMLALLLYCYAFVSPSKIKFVLLCSFGVILFLAFSRTGWIALALFLALVFLKEVKTGRYMTLFSLVIALMVVVYSASALGNALVSRINSKVGRIDGYSEALTVFSNNFFLGDPTARLFDGGLIVHNVPLSIGANYGILPFLFVSALSGFFLFWFLRLFVLCLVKRSAVEKIEVAATVAAFVCFIRPHLSASAENLFSLGEWASAGMVLIGITYISQKSNDRKARFSI